MKRNFIFKACIINLLVAFAVSGNVAVYAGGIPTTESSEEGPGIKAISERLDKLQRRLQELEKKVKAQDKIIESQREALQKAAELVPELRPIVTPPEPKVLVKSFVLNGVNLFDAKDFEPILGRYRNKELTLTELKKVADKITGFYRRKGYITSLAYAPTQEITNNTVEFRVVEGRVGEIKIGESKYSKEKTIRRKLSIEGGQVLNYKKLEKDIKRINKQPDRTVKAVLMPGEEPGTSDILLKMDKERTPWHIFVDYNNRGTQYTGKHRFGAGIINNNLLGWDDILTIRGRAGNKSDVYTGSADYNLPITRFDTRLGAYGVYSHADIGGQFKVLRPEGKAAAYGAYITHPLFDKDFMDPVAFNLSCNISGGLDSISVWNEILDKETSHDEIRVIKAGIGLDERDEGGRTFLSNEVRVGLANFLGSMDKYDQSSSRLDARPDFIKYVGSLSRVSRMPYSSVLVISGRVQYTDVPLLNSEQMGLGGADTIRGFPELDYLGDYGWMSTFELRTPAFLFPTRLMVPFAKEKTRLRDAMQFVYFIDFGEGHLKKARVGEVEEKFLVGAGLGVRFDLADHLRGRVDWGFPVGSEEPSDGSTSTVHVGVQYDF